MGNLETALAENEQLREQLLHAENEMLRESLECYTRYVDPTDALRGPDGLWWSPIGSSNGSVPEQTFCWSEAQLLEARRVGRQLERSNPFAINGHENRINYIVATGHTYKAVRKPGSQVSDELLRTVQETLDDFVCENRWQQRQQEIVRRRDRDGEAFLRLFLAPDGKVRVRFVEPDQINCPPELTGNQAATFGIETDPDDVETVERYWVDGRPVSAAEIQHRKHGVDGNVKRGVPLFYPVRNNLWRAEKLLANMSTVADVQTAIAMIRRHDRATRSAAETFRQATADTTQNASSGDPSFLRRYSPGTILDSPKSIEYEFPAAGLDASRYVLVLQAMLRAVASRLVIPEFMLTSDASNASYSSTLVAEGPAVKMFQRWQADMRTDDLAIMQMVVDAAERAGRLPHGVSRLVAIQVGLPRVATRDEVAEARVNRIYHRLGVKSKQTIAAELGLDYDQERRNLDVGAV